jgi:glycosyltransferase involved in cell wall biosynthesis
MVVVIPSYNNINWLHNNLRSVLQQQYGNFRIIYIDDHSADGTGVAVEKYLHENEVDYREIVFDDSSMTTLQDAVYAFGLQVNSEKHKFTLVRNVNRCGALANLYRAIHSSQPNEIIVTVDGDDWLYHDKVLEQLNEVYSSAEIWFTHGTLIEYPWGNVTWCEPVKPDYIARNAFREFKCPSHLRTFYAWIFQKIPLDDFLYEGDFFPMAWDMAIMFPIAEMSGERHAFIKEVNYVYNMANHINDNKVDPGLQNLLDHIIRTKPRYQRLEKADTLCP